MQLQLHSSAGTSQQICALTSIGIGICMKSFCRKRCTSLLKQELLAQAVQALEAIFAQNFQSVVAAALYPAPLALTPALSQREREQNRGARSGQRKDALAHGTWRRAQGAGHGAKGRPAQARSVASGSHCPAA